MAFEPGKTKPETGAADGTSLDWPQVRCACAPAELFGQVDLIVGMACGKQLLYISMVVVYALLMGYRHAQESECCKGKQQTGLCGGKQL